MNHQETYRVLKPEGYIIKLGPAPGALCGELTPILATVYPDVIRTIAPRKQFEATCPASDTIIEDTYFSGLTVSPQQGFTTSHTCLTMKIPKRLQK